MRQLFVLDPLGQINPAKDSSAALMQAAHRAGDEVWACTPSDLIARGDEPLAIALPVTPEPWITVGVAERQALAGFDVIWMRKDPPVDEAYLYATHLLEVAERGDGRRSVPQVYIDDRHIGGCDDLHALDRAGELDALLKA